MVEKKKRQFNDGIKQFFNILLIALSGILGIIFSVLYLKTFSSGVIYNYYTLFISFIVSIISVACILAIIFLIKEKLIVYKIFLLSIIVVFGITLGLYLLETFGVFEKIKSVEQLREYIDSFGAYAVVLFIAIQFAQVALLPIPGVITIGAGVLLFGPFFSAVYSYIGIVAGSIVAFFIGRVFGYKVVAWLVGDEKLDKWLKVVKGKDKIILTIAFLFPLFPDDILCFIAGITAMPISYFLIIVFSTRLISVFTTSFSIGNSLIPYDTWWGILIWLVLFAVIALVAFYVYKNSEKISNKYKSKKIEKNK